MHNPFQVTLGKETTRNKVTKVVTKDIQEDNIPKYDHGYSEEKVALINSKKEAIEERNLQEEPVTLKEFKEVIVPWNRIQRVTEFILHPVKPKAKPRAKAKPKVKKLTKKFIAETLTKIIFKKARNVELTTEEEEFFNKHTNESKL